MPCRILSCQSWCYTAPLRHVIGTMLLFLLVVSYCQRVCLNIAIVEMVEPIERNVDKGSTVCPVPEGQSDIIKNIAGGKLKWSERDQGLLLAIFFVGYVPFSFVFGYVCDRWGARWTNIVLMIFASITTGVMPLVVNNTHFYVVVFMRFLLGVFQGGCLPGLSVVIGRWVPPNERATIGGAAYAGGNIGVVIGTMGTGQVVYWTKSWTSQFYIWAGLGGLFTVVMLCYLYDGPESDPFVLKEEFEYITSKLDRLEQRDIPYKEMIKDGSVWAIMIAQFGNTFVAYSMTTNLPKYMNNVLRVNIETNSFASSLPYLAAYVASVLFGKISDYFIEEKNAKVSLVRKVLTFVSNVGASLLCLLAPFLGCNTYVAYACFTAAQFAAGIFFATFVNVNDLSNHHAGVLMAIGNGIGITPAFITPYLIAIIAPDNTLEQWQLYFFITLAVAVVTSLAYCFMAKGTRRKWDFSQLELSESPYRKPVKKWYMQLPKDAFEAAKLKRKEKKEAEKQEIMEEKKKMKEEKQKQKDEEKKKKIEEKKKKANEKMKKREEKL